MAFWSSRRLVSLPDLGIKTNAESSQMESYAAFFELFLDFKKFSLVMDETLIKDFIKEDL